MSIQAQVLNLFGRLQREFGLTYVFISHDLSVVRHISDRIAIMYLGQVVELTAAETVYDNPLHPYTRALLSAIPPTSPFEEHAPIVLEGDIPSPIGDLKGCPLASRCPQCTERCRCETLTGDARFAPCVAQPPARRGIGECTLMTFEGAPCGIAWRAPSSMEERRAEWSA